MRSLATIDANMLTVLGALLEERNLTRAGERVYMSQPAMSGALARLRRLLDDELLVRQGRGYELSPIAAELLPRVREALAQAQRTLAASTNFDPLTSTRTFRISISDYALTVLNRRLLRLLALHAPGVKVEFDPLPSRTVHLAPTLLRCDLVIGSDLLQIESESRTVFSERYACIISPRDGDDRRTELSLDDLASLPYITTSFGEDLQTSADMALAEAGVTPRVAVSVRSLLALPFLVSGTDRYAFVPQRLATRCEAELSLRVVETPLRVAKLTECAYWGASVNESGLRWLLAKLAEL